MSVRGEDGREKMMESTTYDIGTRVQQIIHERKTKKEKEKQDKNVQSTKKKLKAIDMTSIVEGGGNIEVESSETKTLGVSEYIVHGGKPCEGRSNHL